jgi:hypothetical protein
VSRQWLWRCAQVFWMAAIISWAAPSVAQAAVVELDELRVSFSQMLTLFAIGLAWGDMRQWRTQVDKRLTKLEE